MDDDQTKRPSDEPSSDSSPEQQPIEVRVNSQPADEPSKAPTEPASPVPTDDESTDNSKVADKPTDSTEPVSTGQADEPAEPASESLESSEALAVPPATPPRDDILADKPSSAGTAATGAAVVSGGKGNRRWLKLWLPIIVVILILATAAYYVFAIYLPNTPANVYKSGLNNTGRAIDYLLASSKQPQAKYEGSAKLTGSLQYQSPDVSGDADIESVFDSAGNGRLNVKADIAGKHFTVNLLSHKAEGNDNPDLYFKVSGVKNMLNSFGAAKLAKLDGKWLLVDHTLLDSYQKQLEQDQTGASSENPTGKQIIDAARKVQAINKQYIFTTDPSKAVLKKEKFIGKETKNGRTLYHYKVGYNKDHLKAYVGALGQALDSSKLNNWAKTRQTTDQRKNISQLLDIKNLQKQIDKADGKYKFDMWVDQKTKLIQSLRFVNPSDKSSVLTISQNCTGGDEYPFSLQLTGQQNHKPVKVELDLTLNKKTQQVNIKLNVDDKSSNSSFSADLKMTPSQDKVEIDVPKDAKSVTDLLMQLLGGQAAAPAQPAQPKSLKAAPRQA